MKNNNNYTETEIRAMRDIVYGKESSDNNWEHCKNNWMTPESIDWLIEHSEAAKLRNR